MRNLFKSNRRIHSPSKIDSSSKMDVRSLNVEVGSEAIEEEDNLKINIQEKTSVPKPSSDEVVEQQQLQQEQDDESRQENDAVEVEEEEESSSGKTEPFLDSWIQDNVVTDPNHGMIAMFNELWQAVEGNKHVRDNTAVRMLVTDPDDSVVSMFREIGTAAQNELSSGRTTLTAVLMMQMERAIHQVVGVWDKAGLLMMDPMRMMMTTTTTTKATEQSHNMDPFNIERGEGSQSGHSFYEI